MSECVASSSKKSYNDYGNRSVLHFKPSSDYFDFALALSLNSIAA